MSCISSDDLIGIIHQCLFDDRLAGPINAVMPESVTNSDFTRILAKVLHRQAIVPLPSAVVNAGFGEMGQTLLLGGAKVLPGKLMGARFEFFQPTVEEAIRWELGR